MPSPSVAPATPRPLNRLFRVSMAAVFAFGLFMQALLVMSVYLAERTLDRGVAPMQELLLIQRQGSQALQLVKRQDAMSAAHCSQQAQDEVCAVPLLLQNMARSVQRLLDGEAGLAGLPPSQALDGEARRVAVALLDRIEALVPVAPLANPRQAGAAPRTLDLQSGLLDANDLAHQLERIVLAQLQQDFRTKHWLDLLAVAAAGVLMAITVLAVFWMWSGVRSAFAQLAASEARLRAYTDAVPDTAYVLDAEGTVLEIMGRELEQPDRPRPIPVGERLQAHRPADRVKAYLDTIHRALATGEVQSLETELPDRQGQSRWFEARVASIASGPGADGTPRDGPEAAKPAQVIWLTRDVTARIRTEQQLRQLNEELEQRMAERTRELQDAAEELRRFNYTVSHDLRAPLRAVEAYTALAVEEAGEALGEGARDLLERARKSAAQLSHMVESLLKLSRIGEMPLQCAWLDLSAMVSEIGMAFSLDQKGHAIEWRIQPGLVAWADEHLMRSVLQNLINNAVKYSAHREPATIAFGQSRQPDGTMAFHVRDNGAGFDMAQASQLFQPFTRLHSAQQFAGDGIGLATVRRIIMRHGGRIWAQGQVDAGATIFFTLPGPTSTASTIERDAGVSRPMPLD